MQSRSRSISNNTVCGVGGDESGEGGGEAEDGDAGDEDGDGPRAVWMPATVRRW
jgi:hypothetical protein